MLIDSRKKWSVKPLLFSLLSSIYITATHISSTFKADRNEGKEGSKEASKEERQGSKQVRNSFTSAPFSFTLFFFSLSTTLSLYFHYPPPTTLSRPPWFLQKLDWPWAPNSLCFETIHLWLLVTPVVWRILSFETVSGSGHIFKAAWIQFRM